MILVVGSAHIDIVARPTGDAGRIDVPGRVTFDVGGTACNCAINVARSGRQARLLTARIKGALSRVVDGHVEAHGVDLRAEDLEGPSCAAFVAFLDEVGDLARAVSCMPVEDARFSDETLLGALEGSSAVCVECNLSRETIERVWAAASERGLPVFCAGVSEEKALRAVDAAKSGARFSAFFCNLAEARFALAREVEDSSDASPEDVASRLSLLMGCPAVVTAGSRGASAAVPGVGSWTLPAPEADAGGTALGAGDAFLAETICRLSEGETLLSAMSHATGTAARVLARDNCSMGDAGAVEAALRALHEGATTDSMTGLLNRAATKALAERTLAFDERCGRPHCAIILDIDHFKSINDTYGHDVGDVVIRAVAARLSRCARGSDSAGRWGGEEFVLSLPGTRIQDAVLVAERIRETIRSEVLDPRVITVSSGVAQARPGESFLEMLARADSALYESKRGGRDRVSAAQ